MKHAIIGTYQHTSDLADEGVIRIGRRSHEVHAPRLKINHEGRVVRNQPAHGPHLRREEIRGGDRVPMGGQKRAPRHRPLRHGADPITPEDRGDRGAGDAMPQVPQRALDPAIPSRGILPRHPDGQVADFAPHLGASHPPSFCRPLPRNKLPVPSQMVSGPWTQLGYVHPTIAEMTKSARVQGLVILEAVISETGEVVRVRVLRSQPLLDAAAIEAVRGWRYTPTLLNNVPVSVLITITLNFRLND